MPDVLTVNGKEYKIIKLLGKGKGGYSYLAESDCTRVVLKQIHHEPCDYYTFGNKIEAERFDYKRLCEAGIRMPKMLDIDIENERILKEYIDGPTVMEMRERGEISEDIILQARDMAELARASGLNIDYYPTNFVLQDGAIYYVDYECNTYDDKWSFDGWGIQHWTVNK